MAPRLEFPRLLLAVILLQITAAAAETTPTETGFLIGGGRPSFWTKPNSNNNNVKGSTLLRMHKAYSGSANFQNKVLEQDLKIENQTEHPRNQSNAEGVVESATTKSDDLEEKMMRDETLIGLKKFADRLINETSRYLIGDNGGGRSYPGEEQTWDDKDQSYHSSSFPSGDYDSYHHHHHIPPPLYYPPQRKDDGLLKKITLLAVLKLIIIKLKALGFLKVMFFFFMKIPILFFKFLFILKGFKLIKLFSIPLLIASLAAPLLPLLPLLAPLLLAPMLFIPLLVPLLLPLLFFLPLVPVSTPTTAVAATTSRKRRHTLATFNSPGNWTEVRMTRNRGRPSIFEASNKIFSQEDNDIESTDWVELAQRVAESQHCMERIACELATHSDSKIYRAAVIWALEKVHNLAGPKIQRKIERYSEAYKNGGKWQSSEFCENKFTCQKPKLLLIQGKSKYNLL